MAVAVDVAPVLPARIDQLGLGIAVGSLLQPAQACGHGLAECATAVPLGHVHVVRVLDQLGLDLGHGLVVALAGQHLVVLAHALFGTADPFNGLPAFIEDHRRLAALHQRLGILGLPLQMVLVVLIDLHLLALFTLALALVLQQLHQRGVPLPGQLIIAGGRALGGLLLIGVARGVCCSSAGGNVAHFKHHSTSLCRSWP